MVFSGFHWSRIIPAPVRDLTCGPKHEYMTLEEAVRAYLQGGAVALPESDAAEFEFPAMTPEDAKKGLSRDQMRSDDIAPIHLDKFDVAASIASDKYAEMFPDKSVELADAAADGAGVTAAADE